MHGSRPSDPHAATVEAFYARVIERVCSSYREENEFLRADEAIERLRQKWQEKLALYTGKCVQSSAITQENDNEISVVETIESSVSEASDEDESSSSSSSASSSASGVSSEQVIGRPSAQLPSATTSTTSSIFTKMLGGKRKLHQLDGCSSDDEDVEWQDTIEQEQQDLEKSTIRETSTVVQDVCAEEESSTNDDTREMEDEGYLRDEEEKEEVHRDDVASPPTDSTTSTSLLVSTEDLSPVSGLSGINLPLQLAAEYSKFIHRGKRRGYFGQLHAIVLTWPSRLEGRESVHPGDLVWCCPDSHRGFLDEGELVKVVSLVDNLHDVKVELSNGTETTVQVDRIRRLKEYLVRKGSVRFRSEQ